MQWQGVLGRNGRRSVIGTNSGGGANILVVTAGLARGGTRWAPRATLLGGGLNRRWAPSFNGRHYLGALANFLQTSGDGNRALDARTCSRSTTRKPRS